LDIDLSYLARKHRNESISLITRHSYSEGNVHEERRARALTLQHATRVSAAQASRGITKRQENLDRFRSFLLSLPHSLFHTLTNTHTHTRTHSHTHTQHTRVFSPSLSRALSRRSLARSHSFSTAVNWLNGDGMTEERLSLSLTLMRLNKVTVSFRSAYVGEGM